MMKQKHMIIGWLMILISGTNLSACDQCGCSVAGSFGGLMAFNTENFAGLRFAAYSFKNYVEHTSGVESHFYSLDLMGSYKINSKWQLFGYLPYKIIDYSNGENVHQSDGIGDAGMINTITLMSNADDPMRRFSNRLSVKAGIEFPTGHFNESFRSNHLPASVSEGTGSFDLITGLQFSYQKNSFNFFADYTYKFHTTNRSHYTFGAQHSISTIVSDRTNLKEMRLLPFMGATIELQGTDHFYDVAQIGTSADIVFANVGFEMSKRQITVGLNYDIPFYSDFGEDIQMSSQDRCSFRINYAF